MQPNAEQFTENAWNAILSAQFLAKERKHQNIETEHLFKALSEEDDLTKQILTNSGCSLVILKNSIETFLASQPKLQSNPESIYIGTSFNGILEEANEQKKTYGDSFISVEHLLIAQPAIIVVVRNY